ncbi:biliverdin-producing heme oxygenase [Bordetella genomosp. 1]|uniref:Biliverdin-producing heme oxygenase n=1 Tax=Bordetella genomosp. 1 TaxID=1395607 RepID=A0A261SH32_9BORD|nr:biliverdin-producing heme oxygenase [Bordetella genomosp. 1]MDQ8031564.1 biliverdin-producing heme oxygenase [Bordetella sp.]OZI36090.1 biliverdin-producing heme oxygenase [Bordetella genomosp. 1]
MTTEILERPALSQRLKHETAAQHERMHQLMERGAPFSSREAYAAFVTAQYLFQRDVEHLFKDAELQAAVPDLAVRGREDAALDDLRDLGAPLPADAIASRGVTMPEGLGWLYVSEGSTLGAAFLFKEVQAKLGLTAEFGARNLAAYPEGRAIVWRRFVAALDSEQIGEGQHDAVIAGANAAYDRFGELLVRHFNLSQ